MIDPASFSEFMLFSTFLLNVSNDNSSWQGTGFFFDAKSEDQKRQYVFLVTNKHVIEGGKKAKITLHVSSEDRNPSDRMFDVDFEDFEDQWHMHSDPTIDLCIADATGFLNELHKSENPIYFATVSEDHVPSQDDLEQLSALETVTMYGYPGGLVDSVNNLPITRRGMTANHPAINFSGRSEGIIDIGVFRGSSGSPIFIINEGSYFRKPGITVIGNRSIFLGIQFSGARATENGQLMIGNDPAQTNIVPVTGVSTHLAFYVKSRELLDLARQKISLMEAETEQQI